MLKRSGSYPTRTRTRPQVLFETRVPVMMIASGSDGAGPVFHGREGDGATLTGARGAEVVVGSG